MRERGMGIHDQRCQHQFQRIVDSVSDILNRIKRFGGRSDASYDSINDVFN